MKKRKALKRQLSILLAVVMVLSSLSPAWAYGETDADSSSPGLLTKENVTVTTVHEDESAGEALELDFDEATKTFSGNLANYTELEAYNDSDISVSLANLPEGVSAQLKNSEGEKIADFVSGTAATAGSTVAKHGEYDFVISVVSGQIEESYTLKLKKTASVKWSKLSFLGTPAFDTEINFYGSPEGTLFQIDDEGNRTGMTGVNEDCYNYEVYINATTQKIKINVGNIPAQLSNYFAYSCTTAKPTLSIYTDGQALIEDLSTKTAPVVSIFIKNKVNINILKDRTELKIKFKIEGTHEEIDTTVTFIRTAFDAETLNRKLSSLDLNQLTWPDDQEYINQLYENYNLLNDDDKEKITQENKEKLDKAYDFVSDDRIPSKVEVKKTSSKTEYIEGEFFDDAGVELLATYEDGTTRTITEGFTVEPTEPLSNEEEVTYTYNTISVKQPITVKKNFEGKGTSKEPYKLSDTEDLVNLYNCVAHGMSYEGKYFEMTDNIELPANWEPIGVTKDGSDKIDDGKNLYAFSGIIDGKNHTLTVAEGGKPLLGYVKGAEVKNLNIYGKKIAGHGLVNNLSGVGLSGTAIVIDNVTLKRGSSTLKSGFIGTDLGSENGFAGCSAGFTTIIRNCTVEEGVVIGYNKDQHMIGSIAGRIHGKIENCKSYATVYGTGYVGGIIGTIDNALTECSIKNCEFGGKAEATGEHVGGIIGGGYSNNSAPNGNFIAAESCSSDGEIIGKDKVGGIMGGDTYVLQSWGQTTFKKNSFTGKVEATDGKYVGGVIGYLESLNKFSGVSANYYSSDCGAEKGIGFVKYVDTSCETHETESGAIYFDTSIELPGIVNNWKAGVTKMNHNRTDDPLGKDAVVLTYSDGQTDPIATDLEISGQYKTEYLVGEVLDLSGMKLTVTFHTGETKELTLTDVEIKDYDPQKRGTQTVSLVYGAAKAQIEVTVLKPDTGDISVHLTVLGDTKHGQDGKLHTLKEGNLTTWVEETTFEADINATVWDILKMADEQNDKLEFSNPSGNYINSVTFNGQTLAEKENGDNSGWMYTLNGVYPELGVSEQYLEDGDKIIFHYTDDYTKEDTDLNIETAIVIQLIKDLPTVGELTLSDADTVETAKDAFDALDKDDQNRLSEADRDKLQSAVETIKNLETAVGLIEAIDEVTLDKEGQIVVARDFFDGLSDDLKAKVENIGVLEAAEKALAERKVPVNTLMTKLQALAEAEDLVLTDGQKVAELRAAYDALAEDQKAYLPKDLYQKLTDAEAKISELEKAEDAAKAESKIVKEKIDAIGEVSLEKAGVIAEARAAYEALSEEAKAMIEAD
ncbi:MAG: bacterial Ig-like domain-containing protein, partial [Emergencia sp.]|nr:bacterial Ig-like domain-containing protein [Emergencia sp.]